MADCRWLSLTFTFLVLLYPTNAKCTGRYGEIQNYLTSSDPLFDNYLNISRAVYPSVDLPSLRILITVKFLSTPCGANASSACLTTNETTIYKYTWSTSCLYVSPQPIELFSMRLFSLWTIWPSRRTSRLHITLPQSCRPPAEDDSTLIYFLSTVGSSVSPQSQFHHIIKIIRISFSMPRFQLFSALYSRDCLDFRIWCVEIA